jgi:hypothetical protein
MLLQFAAREDSQEQLRQCSELGSRDNIRRRSGGLSSARMIFAIEQLVVKNTTLLCLGDGAPP